MKLSFRVRHLAVAAMLLIVALAVAACGSSSSKEPEESTKPATEEKGGETSEVSNGPSWCGSKHITLALADGFGDNNWRKITRAEAENEASMCPSVTEFKYTDGQGNTQKAISDIQGLAAQGVTAMVVFPDAGKAMLPAIRSAYQAGVVTVPYRVFPGGEEGTDYNYYVKTGFKPVGELWGKWVIEVLKGKGKVLNLGGPAGNTQSTEEAEGLEEALKGTEIEIIGEKPFEVTNWDPSKTQQVVAAALAKYPEIDAITTDFGAALASAFPAFKQAGREVPAIATEDSNELSCDEKKLGFPLFTVDSQTWMVRTAIDFAVAKASGGEVPASTEVPQKEFENSVTGQPHPVQCNKSLSGEAILSSHLSEEELAEALTK